jgi:predicted nucleotidyltransferase component of viral defense system
MRSKDILAALKSLERLGRTGFSLNQLRVIVALERLVARLEANPILSQHLIFKGGFALLKHLNSARFTHDLDASYFLYSLDKITPIIAEAIITDFDDGMWFGDVRKEKILVNSDYEGLRLNCAFQIGNKPDDELKIRKLSRIHFDVGLSDDKFPKYPKTQMPSLLHDSPSISWRVYPLEKIFSEKLQTLIIRGTKNSRAKDIYDMVSIYPHCLNGETLINAIRNVFKERNTEIPKSLTNFATDIDLTILRASWISVLIPQPRMEFNEAWTQLLRIFSEIQKDLDR